MDMHMHTGAHLTVYHVNPLHDGVIPLNMDTADLRGDMSFDVKSVVLPVECAVDQPDLRWAAMGDCTNEEVIDDDLVVTKLVLKVQGAFGEYGRCNVCNSSDTDPFSSLPCHGASYLCTCGNYQKPANCNAQLQVGAENVTETFGQFSRFICTWETWIKEPWICWGTTTVNKMAAPGVNMWYSTTAAGWCGAEDASPDCTWSADVLMVVNKSCSDELIRSAVEVYDAKHEGLFARCPHSQPGPQRNTSDPCWIYAFYATVLGEKALVPGGEIAGMPVAILDQAFEQPFLPEAQGGCPAIPTPAAPRTAAEAARVGAARRGRSRYSFGVPRGRATRAIFREAAQLALKASAA